ncbi:sialoadhesin-like isoform X2 [Pempheris klunzingeri]
MIISTNGKSGQQRKGSHHIVERSRMKSTSLVISRVKGEDAGKFTCKADSNPYEHTLLVVSVSASPSGVLQLGSEATLQCNVAGLDPGSTVQWTRPDGQHTGSQTVQLKPVARSDAGTWNCTFSHDKKYSESLNIKVKEPAPTPPPLPSLITNANPKTTCIDCAIDPLSDALLLGLKWWVWVAIGVGCLVVVLLLVLVIVLCKRIRRKKAKLHKMKNSRQPLKSKQYCQCNRPTAAAKPQQGRRREKPSAPPLQPLLME